VLARLGISSVTTFRKSADDDYRPAPGGDDGRRMAAINEPAELVVQEIDRATVDGGLTWLLDAITRWEGAGKTWIH
jgi:hypothetical protein